MFSRSLLHVMSGMLDDNGNLTRKCGAVCSGIHSRATVPPVSRGLGLSSKVVFFKEGGGFLESEGESLVKAENKEDSLPIFSPPINPISSPPTIYASVSGRVGFALEDGEDGPAPSITATAIQPTHLLSLTPQPQLAFFHIHCPLRAEQNGQGFLDARRDGGQNLPKFTLS